MSRFHCELEVSATADPAAPADQIVFELLRCAQIFRPFTAGFPLVLGLLYDVHGLSKREDVAANPYGCTVKQYRKALTVVDSQS